MGDVLWYLTNLCTLYGITLSDLMHKNVSKLVGRMTEEQARNYRISQGTELPNNAK